MFKNTGRKRKHHKGLFLCYYQYVNNLYIKCMVQTKKTKLKEDEKTGSHKEKKEKKW